MFFQGSENREKPLATSFLVYFYFLREQQAMEEFFFPSKLVHSFLVILFSQLLFVTPTYTLTSPGNTSFDQSPTGSLWMGLPVSLCGSLHKFAPS